MASRATDNQRLMVKFVCPKCETVSELNAYDGAPTCLGGGYRYGKVGRKKKYEKIEVPHHPGVLMQAVELA